MLIVLRVNELMNSRTLEDRDNLILSFISFSGRMYVPFFFFFFKVDFSRSMFAFTYLHELL